MTLFKEGDRVRIKRLTDVDTKEPDTDDPYGWIGQTAKVTQQTINDYYDCVIQLENETSDEEEAAAYDNPPQLAMLYCDLEVIK